MLHIFFLILKIIGIIILVILGLLLLLIGIVLLVPVRYKADGRCAGDVASLEGRIKFSWLLHLVRGYVVYKDRQLVWQIKIAWLGLNKEEGTADQVQEEYDGEPVNILDEPEYIEAQMNDLPEPEEKIPGEENLRELEEKTLEATEVRTPEPGAQQSEEIPMEGPQPGAQQSEEVPMEGPQLKEQPPEEASTEEQQSGEPKASAGKEKKTIVSILHTICDKIAVVIEKIKYTFQKICDNIKALTEKKDKLEQFLTDEVHQSAFKRAWREVKHFLKRLLPKRFRLNAHFGFEDPCLTGQILAGAAMIYPFVGKNMNLTPDFEEQVLEGDVSVRGIFRVIYVVIAGWNLLWDKNVRRTYKDVRNFKL